MGSRIAREETGVDRRMPEMTRQKAEEHGLAPVFIHGSRWKGRENRRQGVDASVMGGW